MAKRYHELTVAGCRRSLPILNLNEHLAIAGFVMLGDVELCTACARELAKVIPADTEILMTAETKGIPLAAELARQLGMPYYITARKSIKAYMEDPIWVEDESITTLGKQRLYLLLDDVISTGGSMKALVHLAEKAGAHVIGQAAVLVEGDAAQRKDIIFLETLPLYTPA